jgi:hypothetical protein
VRCGHRRLPRAQKRGSDLHTGCPQRKGRRDSAPIRDSSRGEDRGSYGIDDLRHERNRPDQRVLRRAQVRHPVPGRFGAAGDDRIDAGIVELSSLRDGGRGGDDPDAAPMGAIDQVRRGSAEHEAHDRRGGIHDRVQLLVEVRKEGRGRRGRIDAHLGVERCEGVEKGIECEIPWRDFVSGRHPEVHGERLARRRPQGADRVRDPLGGVSVQAV